MGWGGRDGSGPEWFNVKPGDRSFQKSYSASTKERDDEEEITWTLQCEGAGLHLEPSRRPSLPEKDQGCGSNRLPCLRGTLVCPGALPLKSEMLGASRLVGGSRGTGDNF